jgi:hypothetical protein
VRIRILLVGVFALVASFVYGQEPVATGPALVKDQNLFEIQHRLGGGYVPTFDGQLTIEQGSAVKATVWFLVTKGWAEVVVGPSVSFDSGVGLSFLGGMETVEGYWRINPNFWYGKGKFFTFHAYEMGASGYWYKSTATWAVTKRLAIGGHSQRLFDEDGEFNAHGPTARVKIFEGQSLWVSVLRGDGKTKAIIGLVSSF